jgi:hypothetical protein
MSIVAIDAEVEPECSHCDEPRRTTCVATHHPQTGRIGRVERAAGRISIRLLGRRQQRIDGEELLGGRVVVAGAQVVEARLGVAVLPGVAEGVGGAARAGGRLAVGVVGVGGDDRAAKAPSFPRREAILLLILAVVNAFRSRIEIGRWPRAPYLGLRLILVEDFRGLADAGRGGVGRRTPLKSAARGGARRAGGPRPPTLAVESGGRVAIAWG